MMAGLRGCRVILWLALSAVLGSALGLGEDLDRPLFGPPGSPVRLRESDPGLKKALEFAEERYNRGSNAMHLRKVSRLISATKQVTEIKCCVETFCDVVYSQHCTALFCHNRLVRMENTGFIAMLYVAQLFVNNSEDGGCEKLRDAS